MHKELRSLAAAAALCLTPMVASAGLIGFDFSSFGAGLSGEVCGDSCSELALFSDVTVSGLDSYFAPGAAPGFSLTGGFQFVELGDYGSGGAPPTGNWQLTDGGGDSLFGLFTGQFSGGASDPERDGSLLYAVEGGTGLFGGALGVGISSVVFSPFPGYYTEAGTFAVQVPDTVEAPEPGIIALFATGMGMLALAWTVRRRREALAHTLAD